MCKEISTEDFIENHNYSGWVFKRYAVDVPRMKRYLRHIFFDNYEQIIPNILYMKNDDKLDVIVPESIIPTDDQAQLLWNIVLTYLIEKNIAKPISSYKHWLQNPETVKKEIKLNKFERELLIFTQNHENKTFIGNAMYIPLSENTRLKIEFADLHVHDEFDDLKLTVIDKNNGKIDQEMINFTQIWGNKHVNGIKIRPHLWSNGDKTAWYGYQPKPKDYDMISEQIDNYAMLFSDEQAFTMTQSM